MQQLTIRPFARRDVDRVLDLNRANVPAVGDVDLARLWYIIDECEIALVAVVDGVVQGFCLVLGPFSEYDSVNYRWFMERYDDAMYLDRVAVDDEFRGHGLGRALYAEVDRLIVNDMPGAGRLTLEVNVDPPNEPSLRFHRKLGFEEVGRQMSKGIEVSLMSRPIERA